MAGSKPDWWTTIDDGLTASGPPRSPRRSIAVNYPTALYTPVMVAAAFRSMSATAYQRRASLAFAHWDLGFDWGTVTANEPATPITGLWRIVELGSHDG